MKPHSDTARALNVEGFAKAGIVLHGDAALAELPRLLDMAYASALPGVEGRVHWRARGEARANRGVAPEIWVHLTADCSLSMVCQRCLNAVAVPLHAERSIRFVVGEQTAAQLDAESEDDVLELPRSLDLQALVEDELLLALPLVPRHEACPDPLLAPADVLPLEERPNPFAALGALKRGDALN